MSESNLSSVLEPGAAGLHPQSAVGAGAFRWPMPPCAGDPGSLTLDANEDCLIVGLNGRRTTARLCAFTPPERTVSIQAPSARAPMALRFSQFQSLHLDAPIFRSDGVSPCAYRIQLINGKTLEGQTVGHVSTDFGLFLFPLMDEAGTVQRCFIPTEAILNSHLGQAPVRSGLEPPAELFLLPLDFDEVAQPHGGGDDKAESLLALKVSTPHSLLAAIDRQSRMPIVRIGETLVSMGLISTAQLGEALDVQQTDRTVPLGELLVRMKLVTRKDLMHALARKMGYPLVSLAEFPIDPDALVKVPLHLAARHQLMPLLLRDGALIVAMEDPSRRGVLSELEFSTQCKVIPVLADFTELERAIRDAYAKLGADVDSEMGALHTELPMELDALNAGKLVEDLERAGTVADDEEVPLEQSDNSLVRLVNTMVVEAYTQGVSDIHIECNPGREKVKIRFRKDGTLMPYLELPHNYRSAMIARIKIMCDLDISERRRPQDGKINFSRYVPQYRLELRVATVPTANGMEDVVMRILSSARPLPLEKIGLSARNLSMLTTALLRPYGMILCVGPTGSGKTTALHSALGYINKAERKIWTAEDPVEITQAGLRQVQVNPKLDWTFAKALRAFLRADPDVIMVGEMRDAETASMGIEASLTGHLVLSTLHTNSAPETITRLLDMGMDPFNFADSLLLVMAMRLVKKLCPACRTAEPADDAWVDELVAEYQYPFTHLPGHEDPQTSPAEWRTDALRADWTERFGSSGRLQRYRSVGCAECRQTGYRGRSAIHEVLTVDRDMRHLIQTGARADLVQQQAMRLGMRTLRQDGLEKMLAGITSLEEVRANSNA
jgi:type II secretory ATPase GspE/PulE/Tfp pilus assembly ATPase PilB-like protein